MAHSYNWIDLTGQKFGRLIVISEAKKKNKSIALWLCKCDCGKIKITSGINLRNSLTRSCGCLQKDGLVSRRRTHGNTNSPEYIAWENMKRRCNAPAGTKNYKDYVSKGITVCRRWMKFENFLSDMGKRPSKNHSLDRSKNNGNYEPGNCRWATRKQQANNKSNNKLVLYKGKKVLASVIKKKFGVSYYLLSKYSVDVAISIKQKRNDNRIRQVA